MNAQTQEQEYNTPSLEPSPDTANAPAMDEEPGIPAGSMTLAQVTAALSKETRQGHASHYRIGRLYNYVLVNELAQANGDRSARAYFQKNFSHLSQTTLTLYGTMVKRFPETTCVRHGMYALNLLVTYANAAGLESLPKEPADVPIEWEDASGKPVRKTFAECTVMELRRAVKVWRQPELETVPAGMQARLVQVNEALGKRFPQEKARMALRAQQGLTLLDVKALPAGLLEVIAEAVLNAAPPPPKA